MAKQLVNLVRPGASEHKRTDLFFTYSEAAFLFAKELKGVSWEERDKIVDAFKEKGVYDKDKKLQNVITREKSMFKKLNLVKDLDIIEPTNLCQKFVDSLEDDEEKYFFGLSKSEYSYLLIFLFDDYENKIQGFSILDNILSKRNIYIEYYENPKTLLNEKRYEELITIIRNDIHFASGSPNNKVVEHKGIEYDKQSKAKNHVVDTWLDLSLAKINGIEKENKIDELISDIEAFSFLYEKRISNFIEKSIVELFIPTTWNKKQISKYKRNINNKIIHEDLIPSTYEELYLRSCERVIAGSINDYKNLVNSHIRFLPFINEEEEFTIKEEYTEIVRGIIDGKEELIKEFSLNGYISVERFKEIIDIKEYIDVSYNVETKNSYIESYKNLEEIIKILNLFDLDVYDNNVKSMRSAVDKHIRESSHTKGMCSAPAYYEFIIGLAILQKFKNVLSMDPDEFVYEIKNSLNLKFNSNNLVPKTHAPGGRPDINVRRKEGDIVVEPTLQLINQTHMEADSIKGHLNSYKDEIDIALFVAPKIESDISDVFEIWFTREKLKKEVLCYTTRELVEWLSA